MMPILATMLGTDLCPAEGPSPQGHSERIFNMAKTLRDLKEMDNSQIIQNLYGKKSPEILEKARASVASYVTTHGQLLKTSPQTVTGNKGHKLSRLSFNITCNS